MAFPATVQLAKRHAETLGLIDAQVQRAIDRIADSECPVMVVGEHGTGKRSVAAQIHAQSQRSRYSLTEVHSEAVDARMLEGAFAAKGTLYLTEIGELSLDAQGLIVNRYFRSPEGQKGRLICGTSRELIGDVKSGKMREDFYYLASAITLRLSPLRCRKPEILTIADDLLTEYAKQFDRPKPLLQGEIVKFLLEHTWPENFSELQTAIKTYVAIGDQSVSVAALKAAAAAMKASGARKSFSLKEAARAASTEIERQLIAEVLAVTGGNRKRAADELGISYKALLYKLKQVEYPPAANKNGVAV
jgi:two-component system, NtrC family, response regulator AtoC